jgi:hypothetical protein
MSQPLYRPKGMEHEANSEDNKKSDLLYYSNLLTVLKGYRTEGAEPEFVNV